MAEKRGKQKPRKSTESTETAPEITWLNDVDDDTRLLLTTTGNLDCYAVQKRYLVEAIQKSGAIKTEEGRSELEKHIVGEPRHAILVRAEGTKKAQSRAGKDTMRLRAAATDAVAREVQAEAESLLTSGYEEHYIAQILSLRTWGRKTERS